MVVLQEGRLDLEHDRAREVAIDLDVRAMAISLAVADLVVQRLCLVFFLAVLVAVMATVREDRVMVITDLVDLARVVVENSGDLVTIARAVPAAETGQVIVPAIAPIGTSGTIGGGIAIPTSTTIGTITGTIMAIGTVMIGGVGTTGGGTMATTSIGGVSRHGER